MLIAAPVSTKADKRLEKPVVQTVKLDPVLFVRLKTFGAKTRRSNQDILYSALVEYLNKMKGQ